MRGPARLESLPNEIEHLHKLAENKHAMAAVDDFFEQFIEQIELRRRRLFEAEQTQIAAGLAQAEQTGQHLHPLRAVVRGTAEAALDFAEQRIVGGALRRSEFARQHLLDFGGKFRRDVGFFATEEERSQPTREPTLQRRFGSGGERFLVALAEVAATAEVTRHHEIHQRPEIAHGVFHRRAGEDKALTAAQVEGGLRILRVGVFDVLRFVEHHGVESERAIKFRVAAEQSVTR